MLFEKVWRGEKRKLLKSSRDSRHSRGIGFGRNTFGVALHEKRWPKLHDWEKKKSYPQPPFPIGPGGQQISVVCQCGLASGHAETSKVVKPANCRLAASPSVGFNTGLLTLQAWILHVCKMQPHFLKNMQQCCWKDLYP